VSEPSGAASRSVLVVINALHSGGAERSCIELVRYLKASYRVEVVSLLVGGPAEQELRAMGVSVTTLQATGPWRQLVACVRLARFIRAFEPDTVITFLYLADFIGGVLARTMAPRARIFWNIRNNLLTWRQCGVLTFAAARLNALLSLFVPGKIVYCSPLARSQHEAIGYRRSKGNTVENSPSSVAFRFSEEKRTAFRQGRFAGDFIFLFVGRFDPVKRVDIFVEACRQLYLQVGGGVRFVIAGRGMDADNRSLRDTIASSGIRERFELLGHVSDPQILYSASDCLVVTSESEGSPNSVYEAMATSLPVIIMATAGTEHLAGREVHRLATRNIADLVNMMVQVVGKGLTGERALQASLQDAQQIAEHPLVSYYRNALQPG
jgi:glycosyltransferase involved in cell wall biosynthesis